MQALRIEKGLVDVRFFGQHDRAWIPLANCYLMSKEMPLPVKNKKKGRGPGAKGKLFKIFVSEFAVSFFASDAAVCLNII